MTVLQNLHTHSTWCDGADFPEEMILHAIESGFDSVGFSGHSPMFYAPTHGMAKENTNAYIADVHAMREKYRDRIDIYCGLEFDMFSKVDLMPYDYVIGSVHYLYIDGEYVGLDRDAGIVKALIDTYFGGDGMRYAKAYYETIAKLPTYGRIDIVGHFDLITKHADNVRFFDEDSAAYRRYALEALDALISRIPLFEINTGAIARGYRKTPYPSQLLLKEIKARGAGIVISSDCHNKHFLSQSFSDAVELAEACGFSEAYVLTADGFVPISFKKLKERLHI